MFGREKKHTHTQSHAGSVGLVGEEQAGSVVDLWLPCLAETLLVAGMFSQYQSTAHELLVEDKQTQVRLTSPSCAVEVA